MSKGPIERFRAGAIGRVDEDSAREPALSRVAQALAVLEHLDWWQARHAQWRGRECLNLNAANNTMSPAARNALASRLADKAFSGSPGNRLHPGSHYVDLIEDSIAQLGKEVFGANGIEFRPTSGSHANAVAIFSTVNPGDTILALPALAPAHKSYREQGYAGYRHARVVDIPFNFADFDIDVKALTSLAWRERPKLIVVGSPLCLFPYDLRALRQIADDVGAHILYDAAHPLGLISGGEFQSPLAEGADIVTGSTHKSLPGPIGGVVLVRDADLAERVRRTADDLESNYMNNRILALGITLAEMMAFGSSYARACIENAQQLAVEFSARGITPIGSRGLFTMSNMIVLDTRGYGPATELAKRLESAGIIVSAVGLPGVDGQASGLRIGVQDVTRHGLRVEHIPIVAGLVSRVVSGESPERIRSETRELAETLAHVGYCFDRLDVPEGSP